MARPRKFDEQQTLEAVTEVFWHKGYDGTSINDLIDATGLRPGSLYAAFCNKRTLFLRAINHYAQTLEAGMESLFKDDLSVPETIELFYDFFIQECQTTPQGCFLVNTLFEANLDDNDILQAVKTIFVGLEAQFKQLFERAKTEGTLSNELTPDLAAKILISSIYGLRGYSKLHADPEALTQLKDRALHLLFK